ncbi:27 kDa hemolymph protein [Glossina fuscipes fuscipes]
MAIGNKKFIVTLICFVSVAKATSQLKSLVDKLDEGGINVDQFKNQFPAEFPKGNFSMENAKDMVKDKCIKELGQEKGTKAYQEIESATLSLGECITGIFNYSAMQEEIAEASPKGELDVVFNKYCAKQPDLVICMENFNQKLVPCLDKDERESQDVFMRMVHKLLEFVCHKGGDQIALFIAEKGPECLQANRDAIQNCFNNTFASYVPTEGLETVKSLPKLVLNAEQCEDIYRLETCIVQKLETCEEITPANIIESLFRFMKNETICRNSGPHRLVSGNTNTLSISSSIILSVSLLQLLNIYNRYMAYND